MRGFGPASRQPPPWWPAGEPWPPDRHARRRLRRQAPFVWRAGFFIAPLMFLSVFGAFRLLAWALHGSGFGVAVPYGGWWPLFPLPAMLAIFAFVLLLRGVGRPLGDVVGAADRVAAGDFTVRVSESGPPWIRSIGRAFNSMTSRLQVQQRQRRDLMADVAHELRTPLAIMQGRLEGMLDGVYLRDEQQVAGVLDEVRHLSRLVDDLRTLAHSEGGTLVLQREPTDIAILLEEAAASFRHAAGRRSVSISVEAANDLPLIEIDPLRIREVVSNLLANAVRHAPDNGSVSITARRTEKNTVVEVSDDGPGIPAEDLPKIFDRFHKGPGSNGSGLGLAIAHNLITAHGGTIEAQSTPGRRTTMTIVLPDVPEPA